MHTFFLYIFTHNKTIECCEKECYVRVVDYFEKKKKFNDPRVFKMIVLYKGIKQLCVFCFVLYSSRLIIITGR